MTLPIATDELYRPRTEADAAAWLGVKPETLATWRRESRKAGKLIGPRWLNGAADGKKEIPRYRLVDLIGWQDSRQTKLEPARRPGRPRKAVAR